MLRVKNFKIERSVDETEKDVFVRLWIEGWMSKPHYAELRKLLEHGDNLVSAYELARMLRHKHHGRE